MRIRITQQIKNSINRLGNKTARKSGLKVYTALYLRNERKNEHGYFDCPSTYLIRINSRYYKIIDQFIKDGIIKYQTNLNENTEDLFGPSLITKNYSPEHGYCMKYKFLINIEDGEEIEVDFKSDREYRWYRVIKNSLIEFGYEAKIIRDSFGRLVCYPLLTKYKTELKGKDLYVIDSAASQPRLLYLIMKQRGIVDTNYNAIFDNEKYFYDYLIEELQLKGDEKRTPKKEAQDLFTFWTNSRGYVPDFRINHLFPVATGFIKRLKRKNYKDSSSLLQREEAYIWIDDLLENIPTSFALPVHDSLIVKSEDLLMVLQYCKDKYPDLRFKYEELDKMKPDYPE